MWVCVTSQNDVMMSVDVTEWRHRMTSNNDSMAKTMAKTMAYTREVRQHWGVFIEWKGQKEAIVCLFHSKTSNRMWRNSDSMVIMSDHRSSMCHFIVKRYFIVKRWLGISNRCFQTPGLGNAKCILLYCYGPGHWVPVTIITTFVCSHLFKHNECLVGGLPVTAVLPTQAPNRWLLSLLRGVIVRTPPHWHETIGICFSSVQIWFKIQSYLRNTHD